MKVGNIKMQDSPQPDIDTKLPQMPKVPALSGMPLKKKKKKPISSLDELKSTIKAKLAQKA